MADATSAETGITPASVNTEAPLPQPAGPTGQQSVEQPSPVSKSVAYRSPEFDPKRTDYKIIDTEIDPKTGEPQPLAYIRIIDPQTDKEVARIPRVAGGAIDMPTWTEEYRERLRVSEFQETLVQYDLLSRIYPGRLTLYRQAERQSLRDRSRAEIIDFKDRLEREQYGRPILDHFRDAALGFLRRVRSARPHARHGEENRESIIRSGRQPGYYEEVVFDDSPELKELQARYGGLPRYIFEGLVQEIDKEANRRPSPPLNPLAEQEYTEIKQRRERERPSEKKYTETPAYWGGRYYELLWPESSRDMIDAILDWVKDRISEVGNRDVGTVSKLLDDIRGKGVELLETCRVRLNSDEWFRAENREITETDPSFLRARAFGEGVTDVLGNEKVMYKGNTEFGPQYKERFASEFIAHHDEMYMGNPKVAYILHKLTKVRDGTYWLGHGWDVEKAEEGEIADYRREIEEEIVDDAAAHDLFLSDDMTRGLYLDANGNPILGKDGRPIGAFEYREGGNPDKRDLRFSFDDNVETLLLDPGDQIRQRIEATGDAEALRRHDLRVAVFRRTRERWDEREGLGFVTNQERRQLEGQRRRSLTDKELLARAEYHRNTRRAEIEQQLQTQGYTADQIEALENQIEMQIQSELEAQRREQIRNRIRRKMEEKTRDSLFARRTQADIEKLEAARQTGDTATYDQIAWRWVKDYNEYRIKYRLPRWYPTAWDRTRWNIDRSTKVLDRGALSEEEFAAMFEPIELPENVDYSDMTINQHMEDARFGFQLARSYDIFLMHDTMLGGMRARLVDPKTGEYCGRLPDDETSLALGMIRQVGTDAQGRPIYETVDPNRKMVRVFDVVQARLEMAIAKEAAVIEQAKAELAAAEEEAERTGNLQPVRESKARLEDIFVNSQFVATHALKEIGLVEGKLPVWSHNFLDRSTIYAFTEVLADYGVNVARNERISHNNKKVFYEYLERGRRAVKAEYDRAAQEFMVGTYPVYERDVDGTRILDANNNPVRAVSLFTAASDWGDPSELSERFRVVSKGGMKENTQITDPEFDISTSGGVIFTEAIPWMGDLGFYSMLVWLGVTDIRQLHGYIKRRDEVEYHRHKFFDVMDPINHAKAQAAAYIARRALTGGNIGEISRGQPNPGFLMEPYHGAFRIADFLHGNIGKCRTYKMDDTAEFLAFMQRWRKSDLSYGEFSKMELGQEFTERRNKTSLETLRQMTYLDFGKMGKDMTDGLYKEMYDVLDYFQWALKAAREVQSNRIGNAPRNWVETNTLKWYAFRREMRKSMQRPDPEKGFVIRHGYSPEVASEISIRMMETVLHDADYLILRDYERARRAMDGAQILSMALTPAERQEGFVIPAEKDWSNQPEHIRLALENIRRRGLLEFIKEEGYKIYDLDDKGNFKRGGKDRKLLYFKEILGEKIPPLVQQQMVKEDKSKLLVAA